jgi:hypothetical protein
MPLLSFWKSHKEEVLAMSLDRVVNMAGNGVLADGNETSEELKQYFSEIDPEKLAEYAKHCLISGFDKSGFVLQDVINEIARRLDFEVINGRYQGIRNDIGFDGIWKNGVDDFVVEIKTTDAYLIDLDTPDGYRTQLIESNLVNKNTICLIVVGRNEKQSKALEMQLRGSRHAWSMRIISVDALIKLMLVNSSTSSKEITEKIHTILKPFEYIKVDKIVDVLFAATEEKNSDVEVFNVSELEISSKVSNGIESSKDLISEKRISAIERITKKLNTNFIKRRQTFYTDQSGNINVAIAVSKNYNNNIANGGYWYGYHKRQSDYLSKTKIAYMIYSMLDRNECYAIPFEDIEKWKAHMDFSEPEGREKYWHVRVFNKPNGLLLKLNDGSDISLAKYQI